MDLFRNKIRSPIYHKGIPEIKILVIFLTLLIMSYKKWYYSLIAICIVIIVCEIKYNSFIGNFKKVDIDKVKSRLKTGDFIFFRTYDNYDIPELVLFKICPNILYDLYFTHIGIVVRDNNRLFILESSEEPGYDHISKGMKSGVKLEDFDKRVKSYDGLVFAYENNLFDTGKLKLENLPNTHFIRSFFEYYLTGKGIGCCRFIIDLLQKDGIMKSNLDNLNMNNLLDPNNYYHSFKILDRYIIHDKIR